MSIPDHEMRRLRAVAADAARLEELVARRATGVPLQYLEGTVQFGPIELAVDRRALIPRPETERVWEEAVASLRLAGPGTVIVDLGTGSGALALALKHAFPPARVFGVDISEDALSLAKENASRTGLDVTFLHGDLFDPLPRELMGRVDLLVANPPYVADGEFSSLPPEVREHEPRAALASGPLGTEVLERIADEGFWWVGTGGWVVCEIGETQAELAGAAFSAFDSEVRKDLAGRNRIVVARKGASCCV